MIDDTDLEDVELETRCDHCGGSGKKTTNREIECRFCEGVGSVPTEFGAKVLRFVERNFSLMLKEATDEN